MTDTGSFFERADVLVRELRDDSLLLVFYIISVILMIVCDIAGLLIIKHMKALFRSICDEIKSIFVWGVGIAITLTIGSY
jgi:hypothetical protein